MRPVLLGRPEDEDPLHSAPRRRLEHIGGGSDVQARAVGHGAAWLSDAAGSRQMEQGAGSDTSQHVLDGARVEEVELCPLHGLPRKRGGLGRAGQQ